MKGDLSPVKTIAIPNIKNNKFNFFPLKKNKVTINPKYVKKEPAINSSSKGPWYLKQLLFSHMPGLKPKISEPVKYWKITSKITKIITNTVG